MIWNGELYSYKKGYKATKKLYGTRSFKSTRISTASNVKEERGEYAKIAAFLYNDFHMDQDVPEKFCVIFHVSTCR